MNRLQEQLTTVLKVIYCPDFRDYTNQRLKNSRRLLHTGFRFFECLVRERRYSIEKVQDTFQSYRNICRQKLTCIRVLASSIGQHTVQAKDLANAPATRGTNIVVAGAFSLDNSSNRFRNISQKGRYIPTYMQKLNEFTDPQPIQNKQMRIREHTIGTASARPALVPLHKRPIPSCIS